MDNPKYKDIDIEKLRADLTKSIGGDDGLRKIHLKLSDTELVMEYVYIYGVSALIPYAKEKDKIQ